VFVKKRASIIKKKKTKQLECSTHTKEAYLTYNTTSQGCGEVFQDNWRVFQYLGHSIFTRQVRNQLDKNIGSVSERGKNNSPDGRVGLYF
jgi:hypothetical protein